MAKDKYKLFRWGFISCFFLFLLIFGVFEVVKYGLSIREEYDQKCIKQGYDGVMNIDTKSRVIYPYNHSSDNRPIKIKERYYTCAYKD